MYEVAYAAEAEDDLIRLFDHLVDGARTADDLDVAAAAVAAIRSGIQNLAKHPFVYRKHGADPLLRELLIPFGASGYVALYRILDARRVLILALRHQLESDYH